MAAPGKNKLENTKHNDYFENLISDDDDDLLYAASRDFESNIDTNTKGEEKFQIGPNNRTTSEGPNINKTATTDTCFDKTTNGDAEINIHTTQSEGTRIDTNTTEGTSINKTSNISIGKTTTEYIGINKTVTGSTGITTESEDTRIKKNTTEGKNINKTTNIDTSSNKTTTEDTRINKNTTKSEGTKINKNITEGKNISKTANIGTCSDQTTTEDTRANNVAHIISDESDSDDLSVYTCTPLTIYRPKYLCVTDLTQQDWCEQQLFYKFTMPMMITVPVDEQPVVAKGATIHTERELEVHDVINIKTTSMADRWGIKFLNLLTSVLGFLNGITVAREIPILGVPFNEDVMVFGIIDELRFDPDTYTIDLSELKTKLSRTTSTKAQYRQHSLQVMMYKKLFDDAVKGRLTKDHIQKHLNLDLTQEFGDDLKGQINGKLLDCKNLNELLDVLLQRIQCLTCISQLHLEYVHQQSGETISMQEIAYNESQLCNVYSNCLKFWKGQRSPEGVDIEEAWKCQNCDFESVCEWRLKKAEECRQRNIKKNNLKGI